MLPATVCRTSERVLQQPRPVKTGVDQHLSRRQPFFLFRQLTPEGQLRQWSSKAAGAATSLSRRGATGGPLPGLGPLELFTELGTQPLRPRGAGWYGAAAAPECHRRNGA
ncbi:hypothetical protein [Hymenobacter sp. BRD67]|uniref:hypothetical protein n=1 Tax=Hymenobacter sp. BRD67 TaxID=2675877 RepID=UPI0015676F7D|nr:hypothetical protein [Hymenobacter sp. BRD67]QKG55093.1 hypothetical protein GKZ67_21980 [Hymenobacter sp. BRD67]